MRSIGQDQYNDAHIQGPGGEEKGVSPGFCTHLGQLFQVEKLADGHSPETTRNVGVNAPLRNRRLTRVWSASNTMFKLDN